MEQRSFKVEDLVAYAAEELVEDDARRIRAAAAEDEALRRVIESYRRIIESMRSSGVEQPPEHVVERARALFRDRTPSSEPAKGLIEAFRRGMAAVDRVVATLIYDSRTQPALAGFRGVAETVQLTFEHGELAVDLDLSIAEDDPVPTWRVLGQVATETSVDSMPVALIQSDSEQIEAESLTDSSGMFELAVPGGRYDLLIGAGDRLIALNGIEFGTDRLT